MSNAIAPRYRPARGSSSDLLAGDLPRGLQLPVEYDVEGARALALVEEKLAGSEAALASGLGEPNDPLVTEVARIATSRRRRRSPRPPP